jgi:hypothetical protein
MSLIVDANVANDTFSGKANEFTPIFDALISGKARGYYGGQLAREYAKLSSDAWNEILRLDQAGRMLKKERQACRRRNGKRETPGTLPF